MSRSVTSGGAVGCRSCQTLGVPGEAVHVVSSDEFTRFIREMCHVRAHVLTHGLGRRNTSSGLRIRRQAISERLVRLKQVAPVSPESSCPVAARPRDRTQMTGVGRAQAEQIARTSESVVSGQLVVLRSGKWQPESANKPSPQVRPCTLGRKSSTLRQ